MRDMKLQDLLILIFLRYTYHQLSLPLKIIENKSGGPVIVVDATLLVSYYEVSSLYDNCQEIYFANCGNTSLIEFKSLSWPISLSP